MGRRQAYLCSCGAACLVTAAQKLGTMGASGAYQGDELEKKVYSYTSLGKVNGYSLPSGIIDACHFLHHDLGLIVREVRLEGLVFPKALSSGYPDERNMIDLAGIPVRERGVRTSGFAALPAACLELFVVVVGLNTSLHWLLHLGNNLCMDPDTGTEHNWWASTNNWGYTDTGVSIIVGPGTAPANVCHDPPVNAQGNPGSLTHTPSARGGAWV
jgi:hypothetical protein